METEQKQGNIEDGNVGGLCLSQKGLCETRGWIGTQTQGLCRFGGILGMWKGIRLHLNNFLPFVSLSAHSSLPQMSKCPDSICYLLRREYRIYISDIYTNCPTGAAAQQTLFLQCHSLCNPAFTFFSQMELILLHLAIVPFFRTLLFFLLNPHVLLYVDPISSSRPFFPENMIFHVLLRQCILVHSIALVSSYLYYHAYFS